MLSPIPVERPVETTEGLVDAKGKFDGERRHNSDYGGSVGGFTAGGGGGDGVSSTVLALALCLQLTI